MTVRQFFLEHPATVGETYFEHLRQASGFAKTLLVSGFACLIHGIFPALCEDTGSNAIRELHRRMVTHRT